jgi:chlorite dismutase
MTYHSYIFFDVRPSFLELTTSQQNAFKKSFLTALTKEKEIITYSYATLGLKKDTHLMLWMQSDAAEKIQDFINQLLHTDLGKYLRISYTLFGMTRPTQYSKISTAHNYTERKGGKYLIIYPFNKTKEWYMMSFEKRRELMAGHISIGKKYPQIEQLLLYSFGVDDNEFIVSYEVDDLATFQNLVMELRSDKVRLYTVKDTPIFTCIYKEWRKVLEYM